MSVPASLHKGDRYWAETFENELKVTRVAANQTWADVVVTQPSGHSWRKRQPLVDGQLPFRAVKIEPR